MRMLAAVCVQFGTRHILAAGNRDAGQWLFDELAKHRRLRVSFGQHDALTLPAT